MTDPLAAAQRSRPAASLLTGLQVLVHSNLFISLSTVSVAVTTIVLAGLAIEAIPLFIVFAVTMFVYTVNRFTDLEEDERNVPQRAAFTKRYGRGWLVVGLGLYAAAIVTAVAIGLPGAVYLGVPLVVALLYSYGGVKRIFLVKNCFVGVAWSAIPLGVGYYYGQLWTFEILFLAGYVFAIITIAAVIFDVKDIEGDRAENVSTVPNVFGPRWTRLGCLAANAVVAAVVVAVVLGTDLSAVFLVVLSMNAYVAAYTPFAEPDRGPLYYGFVVDGEHVFLAGIVLVLAGSGAI